MPARIDLVGQTFGKLTVLERLPNQKAAHFWLCQCECGTKKGIIGTNLSTGATKSCGCGLVSHGLTKSPEYQAWKSMWQRCTNPDNPSYERYKDRTPPESWRDFNVFYRDMGPRPSPQHSLDREKNDLPYGPENCRWTTSDIQARNRSTNVWLEVEGVQMVQADFAKMLTISESTVYQYLKKMTVDEILAKYRA